MHDLSSRRALAAAVLAADGPAGAAVLGLAVLAALTLRRRVKH